MSAGELEGRRILVIGGGSGIGLATVRLARQRGARVAATVLTPQEQALTGLPEGLAGVLDVTDREAAPVVIPRLIDRLGGLDGFVYCAGILLRGPVEAFADADWDRTLEINLGGAFRTLRHAIPLLSTGASITIVSSQIGLVGYAAAAAYAASKSGLNGFVRAVALEMAGRDIRVNAVAPGPIATAMTEPTRGDPDRAAALAAAIPMGRFGEATEVAEVISFLVSTRSSFVTGQVWCVDGGYVAR